MFEAPADPTALLANEAWLRPLVRSLVDGHTAEDVLQETWLAALRQPPKQQRATRSWLATVATNFARSRRRAEARQQRHAARAQTVDAAEAAASAAERLELQAAVSRAVLDLAEPFRTVVLLRHFHGLDIATIAARTDTSAANVRQRLHRGLDQLRQLLANQLHRGNARSPAVLALLAEGDLPATVPIAATHALFTMTKIRLVAAPILLAALAGGVWWLVRPEPALPVGPTDGPIVAHAADERAAAPGAAPSTAQRVDATDTKAADTKAAGAARPVVRGRIVDHRGNPTAGVVVHAPDRPKAALASSDLGGQIELRRWPGGIAVAVPWVALATQPPTADQPFQIAVAPGQPQSLQVVDELGGPVVGAAVHVDCFALREFPTPMEQFDEVRWPGDTTDASGRCQWPVLPRVATSLRIQAAGFRQHRVELSSTTAAELLVSLQRRPRGHTVITGTVTDSRGNLMAKARVGVGPVQTTTDRYGNYELLVPSDLTMREHTALYAASDGFYPTEVEGYGQRLRLRRGEALQQDLQLGQPALTITGVVLDVDGKPCRGAMVLPWELPRLSDRLTAADLAMPADTAPYDASGNEVRCYARTDGDGRFVLQGCGQQDYRLRVIGRGRDWAWTTAPIAGGSQRVELRLPAATHGTIAGVVRDRRGQPAAGVSITVSTAIHAAGGSNTRVSGASPKLVTDADGRFRIRHRGRLGVEVCASGEDWIDGSVELAAGVDPTAIALTLLRSCHVRVELTAPDFADGRVEFVDGDGKPLMLVTKRANRSEAADVLALEAGKTGVLAVSETAAAMVLSTRDRSRSERVPVTLVPGQINTLVDPVR